MENIVIFIIIIVISSIISKNKKKQQEASRQDTGRSKPVFNEQNKKKDFNTQPPQLGELLKQLKNLKKESEGTRKFEELRKSVEQTKPAGDKEYSTKPVSYDERTSEDALKETYTYDTPEKDYDSAARSYETEYKSYDEMPANEERAVNYEEVKGDAYMDSVRRIKADQTQIQKAESHHIDIFNSRTKLKNAIIASEILKRKYT